MIDYIKQHIDIKSIRSFENSDVILAVILCILDIFLILVLILNIKNNNKQIITLKSRLIKIFMLDIIIRALYVRKYYSISFPKEILLSILITSQFYYILSFIDHSKINHHESKENISKERKLRIKLCIFFIFLIFTYENFSFKLKYSYKFKFLINKTILIIKNYCFIVFLLKLYKIINPKIREIGTFLFEKQKNKKIAIFIIGSSLPCTSLFCLYYLLKIGFVFVTKPVFFIYGNIILNIIKDTSKYYIFIICEAIFYALYSNQVEEDKEINKAYIEEKITINN